jgi:hypothetical protein
VKPFVKNVYVIVLLFPTSMFAIQIIHEEFGQSWFCYVLHVVYASRFFSQKTQDAKRAIICPNGGVYVLKRSISSRKLQAT